jgi:hypothetical protein
MKFLFYQVPRCGNHSYDIKIYNGPLEAENLKIPDYSFEESVIETETLDDNNEINQETIQSIIDVMKEYGEDPHDPDGPYKIYSLLYDELITKNTTYKSQYSSFIEEIISKDIKQSQCIDYYVGEPDTAGNYDKSQRRRGWIYTWSGKDIDEPYIGMELYITKVKNGWGCGSSALNLGIFSDKDECLSFEQKVDDALKDFTSRREDQENWISWSSCTKEKYVLSDDLITFKQVNR